MPYCKKLKLGIESERHLGKSYLFRFYCIYLKNIPRISVWRILRFSKFKDMIFDVNMDFIAIS